jgi:hypothetical protein
LVSRNRKQKQLLYKKDMKTKSFLAALLAVVSMGNAQAQSEVEGSLEADFVSSYIWRGFNLGHVSLQPELSVGWKGLSSLPTPPVKACIL